MSLSLLRCCDIMPADALYYNAGEACKYAASLSTGGAAGQSKGVTVGAWGSVSGFVWERAAQLLWRRFCDLNRVISSPGSGNISEDGFEDAEDIPDLLRTPLPRKAAVSAAAAAEAGEWVLESLASFSRHHRQQQQQQQQGQQEFTLTSTFPSSVPALPVAPCPACGTEDYALALRCGHGHGHGRGRGRGRGGWGCGTVHEPCAVTGAPLANPNEAVECSHRCGARGNKEDWDAWVAAEGSCPWCGRAEVVGGALGGGGVWGV